MTGGVRGGPEKPLEGDLGRLAARLRLLEPAPAGPGRPAAVMVPLVPQGGVWGLVLTQRPELVAHHKGQISFPGGALDEADAGPLQGALREAQEEIGVRAEEWQVLGRLPGTFLVSSGFFVHPFVAALGRLPRKASSPQEVAEIFWVPLWSLRRSATVGTRAGAGAGNRRLFAEYRFEGRRIWGATARIVHGFLRVLDEEPALFV